LHHFPQAGEGSLRSLFVAKSMLRHSQEIDKIYH
jgi:hypothetical protein